MASYFTMALKIAQSMLTPTTTVPEVVVPTVVPTVVEVVPTVPEVVPTVVEVVPTVVEVVVPKVVSQKNNNRRKN